MTRKLFTITTILSSILVIILVWYFGCDNRASSSEAEKLTAVEISEYQGENLSSITEFRENSIKGPQLVDEENYELIINGLADNAQSFSYEDVINNQQNYSKVITLNCVEGWSVRILWEGILVRDLIKEVNPDLDANTIIFHAYDGYTTSLPLSYFTENDIIIAYKMNGVTLPAERGFPFQLVAESKWGYKWIKWITQIELSDDESYQGYWESRGYSNDGNLWDSFFERR